jgi:hypothetical protein
MFPEIILLLDLFVWNEKGAKRNLKKQSFLGEINVTPCEIECVMASREPGTNIFIAFAPLKSFLCRA